MSRSPVQQVEALRIEGGQGCFQNEMLAQETAIALVYNGLPHVVMMATPADLEDFGLGFSLSEGIIENADDLRIVDCSETADGISLQMWIAQPRFDALAERGRNLIGRSGCGLCGTESLAQAIRPVRRVPAVHDWQPQMLFDAFAKLETLQPLNAATGAVHAAGILCSDGNLYVREDVGRHNAIDKAVGLVMQAGLQPQVLLVTSRASYEVVHKAAQIGISVVAAISAPTALAVRIAGEAGLVLAGFARDRRLTVYAGANPDRAR